VTIAVQKITNNNTLDIWNEQSNVGERVFFRPQPVKTKILEGA